MKTLKSLFCALVVFSCSSLFAADDAVLMTIDNQEVTKNEFEYIYRKNNANSVIDKKSLNEYVELFKNFKLKVIEAQNRGMDTLPAFINELRGYRNQLAKPYLTDLSMEETLCKEAYEHLKQDVEVSHILIRLPENPMPADTLAAYNKALDARKRLLKGEDFGEVAKALSDDPSVKNNNGYLGYFTGGMLVYPFEKEMFTINLGEISEPVRTFYGYHVVKVHNRRPACGQVRVSHIMKMVKQDAPEAEQQKAHEEILAIADRLKNGDDFSVVARETSDDKGTASRGGALSWFGVGRMVREFETAAFALQNVGDVSEPVRSPFGWHIIKLEEKRGLEPYEVKRQEILRQMQRDERASMGRTVLVDRLKKEYNYQEKAGAMDAVVAYLQKHPTADSVYMASVGELTDTFATFADVALTQEDLAFFIGLRSENGASQSMLDEKVKQFVESQILAYEDTQLENKYPEFRYLMQEYHDGILLFEISNAEVWDKAAKDVEGLKQYFVENKANYAWETPHYKGRIVRCKDAQTAKIVKKMIKKLPTDSVESYLNARVNNDSVTLVKTEVGLWQKGDNATIDKLVFGVKSAEIAENEELPIVFVTGKKLKKYPEVYTDVRGAVTADYQNELERRWIEALRAKYSIEVDESVLKTIE